MDSCLGFLFFGLFCSVFLVHKINVRSCVSPPCHDKANTCRGDISNNSVFFPSGLFFFPFVFLFFFFKSLLVACPTHTNPPGSGLGTGGIVFDKHIDKSTQQMNLKVHSYIFFTMRLAVKHSISSS